jgi:hypothetical protein
MSAAAWESRSRSAGPSPAKIPTLAISSGVTMAPDPIAGRSALPSTFSRHERES